jgi:tetratricopeptide (TPR) repeat protein
MPDRSEERTDDGLGDFPKSLFASLKKSQIEFDIDFFGSILSRSADYVDVLRCQGELLSRKGRHAEAVAVDRRLAALLPNDSVVHYNLACSLAQSGLKDEALAALRSAFELGYDDFDHLDLDADLAPLAGNSAFEALLAEFRPKPAPVRRPKKSRRK